MATAAQIKSFIQQLGGLAVAESNRRIAAGKGFVLPSVCIAQSAIETGWGTAGIMTRANAYFGIKAGGSWTGAVYRADTWEVADGAAYNTTANFRAYSSLEHSVADYYDLIGNASRYSKALSYGKDRTAWKTPYNCIHAIWSGGYATDTLYVEKIMNTINARDLKKYDAMVTGEGTPPLDLSTGGTGTPIINNAAAPYSKVISSFVQGTLLIIDSGRAIENNKEVDGAVSTEWSKAVRIPATGEYNIKYPKYDGAMFVLSGDIASSSAILGGGDFTAAFNEGDKVGFTISGITIEKAKDIEIVLENNTLPAGDEVYSSGIAYFIRV